MKNYIGFVNEHSGSMGSLARWLVSQGHRQVPVVYVDGKHVPIPS